MVRAERNTTWKCFLSGGLGTRCADALVVSLTTNRGYDDLHRTLKGLRERLEMVEAVARLTEETRGVPADQSG